MADDRPHVPREPHTDDTHAELSISDLKPMDPRSDELALEEIEEVDSPRPERPRPPHPPPAVVASAPAKPPPPSGVPRPKTLRPGAPKASTGPKRPAARSEAIAASFAVTTKEKEETRPTELAVGPARLRELCQAQIDSESDPERKARLHCALARLYEMEIGDREKAAEQYQLALRHSPHLGTALRGARRVSTALGRFALLPPLFDAEVQITRDPAARARVLYAKARILETKLRQAGPALLVDREALALDPGNVVILKAIERGERRDHMWQALAHTYETLANAVEDKSLRSAWSAVSAHIAETKLSDPVRAATLYESALDLDPYATGSLAHVKRLAAAQARWQELVVALRKEHALCQDADLRQIILATIAQIEERRIGDAGRAIKTIEEALAVRPDDRSFLRELARLCGAHGRYAAEASALARLVERTQSNEEIASLAHQIGRILEQELKDEERARPWYERALAADPAHRSAALALVRLFTKREDWAGLLRVLTTRANAITTPAEQSDLFQRMGDLLERLNRHEEAIAQHARALGLDPSHHQSFLALARLLTAAGRWRELAELYGRAIDRAPHDSEAIAWLFRLGGVLEDRLGDLPGAIGCYERILQRDPKHFGALHHLARTAERAGRHEKVVEALRAEANLTADESRRNALLHRAAVMSNELLGDPAGAARALEGILQKTPAHRPSLESLAELKAGAGMWEELVAIHRRLLPLLHDTNEKVRLLFRMGEIQETQLGRDADAIASFRQAQSLDPTYEPATRALLSALERTNAYGDLAKALEDALARIVAPLERARAATDLGVLYEEKVKNPQQALASYEKAIAAVPLHRPALDARERLLSASKDPARLVQAIEQEATSSPDEFSRTQAFFRAAFVRAEHSGVASLEAFRPVFTAQPAHLGALIAVEDVYRHAGDDAGLSATYERMAEVVTDKNAKLAALEQLARARTAQGIDAGGIHQRILSLAPNDVAALEELATGAELAGDLKTAIAMHGRLATVANDATIAADHHIRIGEMLLSANDPSGALGSFRTALSLDARSISATDGLTRAARGATDPVAMQEAARHEVLVTLDHKTAVNLLLNAARLHYQADREDEAAVAYEEALSLDPDNPEGAVGLMGMMMRIDRVPRLIDLLTHAAHTAKDRGRVMILHLCTAQLQADVLEDLPAAVAATQRALAARPDYVPALMTLAIYLERNGQWNEAVDTLERTIAKARDPRQEIEAHLRLARIAEKHLNDPARAMRSHRVVLEREAHHAEALTALVRLERISGRAEEALRLARKLISVVTDDVPRAAALSELAELETARGELSASATAALSAIAVEGPLGPSARLFRGLVTSAPQYASWDDYCNALMSYLERAKSKGGDVAETYRELARVFGDAGHRPEQSIAILRDGVRACPQDSSISLALVRSLRQAGADAEALGELRRFLSDDCLEVGAWRNLAEVLPRLGVADGMAVGLAPLVALGQASADEERTVRGRHARAGRAPQGILSKSGLEQLSSTPALDDSAAAFILGIGEIITKMEGIEYERWGLSKRDRIRAGDPHPLRAFADRIGRAFAVPEYDLFVGVGALTRPFIFSGSPPALLVPAGIEHSGEAKLAFHIARPLALLSRGLQALDHIDDGTMERFLVATVRQFKARFRLDPMLDEEEIEHDSRRVAKTIGFFSRGRIQEAVTAFAASPTANYPMWARDIRRLAARAALLISDDLVATLEALGEPLGPDNYASDLARFWVSDPAIRFRRAVAQQSQTG